MEKKRKLDKLISANQNRAAVLVASLNELTNELINANKELAYQNEEKEKRAEELIVANKELLFQNAEKEKRAAELIVANKELAYQNEEKEKRAAELIIANKELKQFAYIASHELKEPLRTISNFIQMLNEDYYTQLDDTARNYLQVIENSAKRMTVLIRSLLYYSRLGIDKKLIPVDCQHLMSEIAADLDAMIKSSNATIESFNMPVINAYGIEIRQVFQNLIVNAIKFQKKDALPNIKICSEKLKNAWKFSVSDNGIGIAPDHFDRIFDIFQRLSTNEDEFEGTGIGLAYCKKIIQLHQGEIWVTSDVGKGTTFHFTIPNL